MMIISRTLFIGVEYRDIATEALVDAGFYQITGGAIPVVLEVDAKMPRHIPISLH